MSARQLNWLDVPAADGDLRRTTDLAAPNVWLDRLWSGEQQRAWATFDAAPYMSRVYRYSLGRVLDQKSASTCAWVMLNPSTADAFADDPTIRRCIGFARAWGYDRTIIVNLFALRSTDPRALYSAEDPIGPLNDGAIRGVASTADVVVAAWGKHGALHNRGRQVARLIAEAGRPLCCLAMNKDGSPAHPLYQPGRRVPLSWAP